MAGSVVNIAARGIRRERQRIRWRTEKTAERMEDKHDEMRRVEAEAKKGIMKKWGWNS